MSELLEQKYEAHISFFKPILSRRWIDSILSRFVDELPEKYVEKINNYEEVENEFFDFNQDCENEDDIYRSPGS